MFGTESGKRRNYIEGGDDKEFPNKRRRKRYKGIVVITKSHTGICKFVRKEKNI